ncbi:hypothetical protein KY289_001207 [Solanum tuberosum]|nr:hypothetical protein KY289_001207 [Solanum tuberosum]
MLNHIGSKPIQEIIYQKGGKDGNPPDLATIFFETRKKDNKLVEPEAIEKHPCILIWGWSKGENLKGGTSPNAEILFALRSTRDDNKFLNEENKSLNEANESLNDRLSTLEDAMKEILKMKELFAAQQSDVPPTLSPLPTE